MEFNYLVERTRMLNSLGRKGSKCSGVPCEVCPLYRFEKSDSEAPFYFSEKCGIFESEHPIEATNIVRKWAEEHPRKTRKDVLLEKFPNSTLKTEFGNYLICAQRLGLCKDCLTKCEKCWNTEVEE